MNRPTPPIRATEYGEVKHTRTDCSLGRGVTLGTHRSRRGRRYNNISLGAIPLTGVIAAMPDILPTQRNRVGAILPLDCGWEIGLLRRRQCQGSTSGSR